MKIFSNVGLLDKWKTAFLCCSQIYRAAGIWRLRMALIALFLQLVLFGGFLIVCFFEPILIHRILGRLAWYEGVAYYAEQTVKFRVVFCCFATFSKREHFGCEGEMETDRCVYQLYGRGLVLPRTVYHDCKGFPSCIFLQYLLCCGHSQPGDWKQTRVKPLYHVCIAGCVPCGIYALESILRWPDLLLTGNYIERTVWNHGLYIYQ